MLMAESVLRQQVKSGEYFQSGGGWGEGVGRRERAFGGESDGPAGVWDSNSLDTGI